MDYIQGQGWNLRPLDSRFRGNDGRMGDGMSAAMQSAWEPAKLPKIAYGKGSYLYDTTGKQYIDGSGGPAVYCLGHANEEVNNAIKAQLDRIAHGFRYTFTSDPLEQLTDFVIRRC